MDERRDDDGTRALTPEEDAFYADRVDRILADDINTPDSAHAYEGEDARRAVRLLFG